jgi:hypothetical protein
MRKIAPQPHHKDIELNSSCSTGQQKVSGFAQSFRVPSRTTCEGGQGRQGAAERDREKHRAKGQKIKKNTKK